MPNSDSTITRTELIKRSFRGIGVKNPTTRDLSDAVGLLNAVLKELDSEGRWLWAISNTITALTLVASTRSYSVGTAPTGIASNIMALETFELVQGTSYTPLRIIEKTEALTTTLREGVGTPSLVYLEKAPVMTNQKIHIFQTPGAGYTAQYTYRRRLYDFDNASDNPDFPQEWEQKLVKILRSELAPEYGIPLDERSLLMMEAEKAKLQSLSNNSETSDPSSIVTTYF